VRTFAVLALVAALTACSESHAATPQLEHLVAVASPSAAPQLAARPMVTHPWDDADLMHVQDLFTQIFANIASSRGVAVVADDGTLLVDLQAYHPLTPASTIKLLVGSTSFFTLQPGHRLTTSFATLDPPDQSGEIGDLWLVGGGDPVLSTDDLVRGVGMLRRQGVHSVRDLVVDASAFTGPEQNPKWDPDDLQYDYAAGTSAISLDEDNVRVYVPDQPGVFVWHPMHGIPTHVAAVTHRLLAAAGIDVTGAVRVAQSPLGGTVLWAHRSPPLRDLVAQMFLESDNHIAEQLLRILGDGQGAGTELGGARAEREFLNALHVPVTGLTIFDGSGLAGADRVAPVTLATLLARAAALPAGPAFIPTLPRVGIEGTVRHHDLEASAGRVRAKSGHIEGVDSLAGYVQTRHHGRITFAFIVNDPAASDASVEETYDRALDQLSEL
jgi:D-alanyl-D-alanine carboxypeptidase/D-alanyl-D-alanine-endopeptidase (penicillin-binding protein 4)